MPLEYHIISVTIFFSRQSVALLQVQKVPSGDTVDSPGHHLQASQLFFPPSIYYAFFCAFAKFKKVPSGDAVDSPGHHLLDPAGVLVHELDDLPADLLLAPAVAADGVQPVRVEQAGAHVALQEAGRVSLGDRKKKCCSYGQRLLRRFLNFNSQPILFIGAHRR